jgi:2-polyprenyl-6-methoxyphenol hydroxylase-like FAD-dependent oxidoreductase
MNPDGRLAMNNLGDHAVVLGASMGGLLAARVLADFYRTVTIVERDVLPNEPVNRRGVPQGRHVHALLTRGSRILEQLFPGLLDEVVAGGAPVLDGTDPSEGYFSFGGHLIPREGRPKDPIPLFLPSRPMLEYLVRQRVRNTPNIAMLEAHDVVELTSNSLQDRVTGVRVCAQDGGAKYVLAAELVVDATGRGSRTPTFLDNLGYNRPTQDHIDVRLTYTSQLLRLPPGALKERVVIISPLPGRPTGMALFGYENNSWIFTAIGMAGREAPRELTEILAFVEDFTPAHVVAALRDAEPVGQVARHRMPSSQWRRYDKMGRFPAGLLVFGDAICSFNPIYGQGMTVAALQAEALRHCLQHGSAGLARRHFRAAAKPISVAWQLAAGGDLNLPDVEGPRPLSVRIANRYVDRLQRTAESDVVVAEQFVKVTGLIDPPARLLHPRILFRVVLTSWRQRSRHRPLRVDSTTTLPSSDRYGHTCTHR